MKEIMRPYSSVGSVPLHSLLEHPISISLPRHPDHWKTARESWVSKHVDDNGDVILGHFVGLTWLTFSASARCLAPWAPSLFDTRQRRVSAWEKRRRAGERISAYIYLTWFSFSALARALAPSLPTLVWSSLRILSTCGNGAKSY